MSSKCFERLALQADACGVTRLQAQALLQIRQRTEISVSRAWTRRWAINQIERLRAGVGHAVSDALAGTSTPAACEGRSHRPLLPDRIVAAAGLPHRNVGWLALVMERRRPAGANNRSPWCPFQEAGVRERIEHVLAILYADVPQAPGLPERQFEAWHLHEIGAYAIDEGSDVHGGDKSNL